MISLTTYLAVVLGLAAVSSVVSLGVVTEAVVRNHRTRLARHESMRVYYGRLAHHHGPARRAPRGRTVRSWQDRAVRHVYECQMRRADLHPGGTVDNVVYVDYLQEARLDLLRHHDTSPTPQP